MHAGAVQMQPSERLFILPVACVISGSSRLDQANSMYAGPTGGRARSPLQKFVGPRQAGRERRWGEAGVSSPAGQSRSQLTNDGSHVPSMQAVIMSYPMYMFGRTHCLSGRA
jgi:hypothetical protein